MLGRKPEQGRGEPWAPQALEGGDGDLTKGWEVAALVLNLRRRAGWTGIPASAQALGQGHAGCVSGSCRDAGAEWGSGGAPGGEMRGEGWRGLVDSPETSLQFQEEPGRVLT